MCDSLCHLRINNCLKNIYFSSILLGENVDTLWTIIKLFVKKLYTVFFKKEGKQNDSVVKRYI